MAAAPPHPVRLRIADDLRRGRGSVIFRLWFALPFLLWLGLWSIAAFFAALANWLATLVMASPPPSLHQFLARYVRFATHATAYLDLAAEAMPGFDGRPGYAIDLEIDPPAPQSRWSVLLRLPLAVPALILLSALAGTGATVIGVPLSTLQSDRGGLLAAAAFLGWFSAVALTYMPRGLRDAVAYSISYAAQCWAYLLLLTDRYPSSDPLTALPDVPAIAHPVWLELADELRRSRLTVLFRLPLAFPHLLWLTLWGIAVLPTAIVAWLVTLIGGTLPDALHRFLAAYTRYGVHVGAFLFLIGNPFPGFTGREGGYPLDLHIAGHAPQSRWKTLVRAILALPALLLAGAYTWLLLLIAFLGWFAALATGRMPLGMRNAGALALRYRAQLTAYGLFLTSAYPYGGPCRRPAPAAAGDGAPLAAPAAI